LRTLVSNVKGIVSLIVYLAVIVGVCFAAWHWGIPLVREKLTGGQSNPPAAGAPLPGTPVPGTPVPGAPAAPPSQPAGANGH
jgi:hypothetical protein